MSDAMRRKGPNEPRNNAEPRPFGANCPQMGTAPRVLFPPRSPPCDHYPPPSPTTLRAVAGAESRYACTPVVHLADPRPRIGTKVGPLSCPAGQRRRESHSQEPEARRALRPGEGRKHTLRRSPRVAWEGEGERGELGERGRQPGRRKSSRPVETPALDPHPPPKRGRLGFR